MEQFLHSSYAFMAFTGTFSDIELKTGEEIAPETSYLR